MIIGGGIVLIALSIVILKRIFRERVVNARVFPSVLTVKDSLHYVDNTSDAKSWKWEFGNRDNSHARKGGYQYQQAGTYLIRLVVDNKLTDTFQIEVKDAAHENMIDSLARIEGPTTGIQGQNLVFRALGAGSKWEWNFGEPGEIGTSYYGERTAFHVYLSPGRYTISLSNENTKYPYRQEITIFSASDNDNLLMENPQNGVIARGNDIKEHLQAIADGKSFKSNYYYIVRKYLCSESGTVVIIDGQKQNDFYSYCMGLRFKNNVLIDNVIATPGQRNCIVSLTITQHNRN